MKKLAIEKGCTPGQLALAWVLAQGEDVVPIPGTKQVRYLQEIRPRLTATARARRFPLSRQAVVTQLRVLHEVQIVEKSGPGGTQFGCLGIKGLRYERSFFEAGHRRHPSPADSAVERARSGRCWGWC